MYKSNKKLSKEVKLTTFAIAKLKIDNFMVNKTEKKILINEQNKYKK